MTTSIEQLVNRAKIAEMCDDHHHMAATMKAVVEKDVRLSHEEIKLFSMAYENLVMSYRITLRDSYSRKQKPNTLEMQKATSSRATLKWEIYQICREVLNLVHKYLLPNAVRPEEKALSLRIWSDYSQYLAEIVEGDLRRELAISSEEAYEEAVEIARVHLAAENPVSMDRAFHLLVLYMVSFDSPEKALQVVKEAFGEAVMVALSLDGAQRFKRNEIRTLNRSLMMLRRDYHYRQ